MLLMNEGKIFAHGKVTTTNLTRMHTTYQNDTARCCDHNGRQIVGDKREK